MTQDWQSAVDSSLVRRLMRPVLQPSAIGNQLGASILARTEQMTNHLPLLVQFAQRQVGVFQPDQIPIVYAQPSTSVQVVHSQIDAAEPLTIVHATLVSSTSNDYTSNSTTLNIRELRQEQFNAFNSTHPSIEKLRRSEFKSSEFRSMEAIASPSPVRSSTQNLLIVNAQNISNEFKRDRPTQLLTVRPLTSGNSKLQNPPKLNEFQSDRPNQSPIVHPLTLGKPKLQTSKLGNSSDNLLPQAIPIRPVPPASPILPTIAVRTGTEAAPPSEQFRTHLNETATTLPIVFAQPNPAPALPQSPSRTSSDFAQFTKFPSPVSLPMTKTFAPQPPPEINLDTLTTQVERKLLRRLVVESERRGQNRWR